MTPDEIVEAVARGRRGMSRFQWERTPELLRKHWCEQERAALRALPPGVVLVAGVPDARVICPVVRDPIDVGFNRGIDAVLARVVEVGDA